jgi:hypothetical protein
MEKNKILPIDWNTVPNAKDSWRWYFTSPDPARYYNTVNENIYRKHSRLDLPCLHGGFDSPRLRELDWVGPAADLEIRRLKKEQWATRGEVLDFLAEMRISQNSLAARISREPRRLRRELSRSLPMNEKVKIGKCWLDIIRKETLVLRKELEQSSGQPTKEIRLSRRWVYYIPFPPLSLK